jgi:hypothetical protein
MPDAATARLAEIRRRHAEASSDWQFALTRSGDEAAMARIIPVEDPYQVLTFASDCAYPDRDFVLQAHGDQGFLLELLDEAFAVIRRMRGKLPKPKDYAAECGMKCDEAMFQKWLFEVHGLDDPDAVKAATKVRFMLQIDSRAALNTDPDAAARWRKMIGDFEHWLKHRSRR